jgi:hypothetical protein
LSAVKQGMRAGLHCAGVLYFGGYRRLMLQYPVLPAVAHLGDWALAGGQRAANAGNVLGRTSFPAASSPQPMQSDALFLSLLSFVRSAFQSRKPCRVSSSRTNDFALDSTPPPSSPASTCAQTLSPDFESVSVQSNPYGNVDSSRPEERLTVDAKPPLSRPNTSRPRCCRPPARLFPTPAASESIEAENLGRAI